MKQPSAWFIIGFVVVLAGLSTGFFYIGTSLLSEHVTASNDQLPTGQCTKKGIVHYVSITHDAITPGHITGKLCDSLTITNYDNALRLVAFGPHEHHTPYDGITEKVLDQNQSLTVMLNQTGNFTFHDHLHDTIVGTFTVTR